MNVKEKCEWLEVGSTRAGKGKGKEPVKPVIVSPCGGEKHKRPKKVATKGDDNDNNEIKEVTGPLKRKGKERSGFRSANTDWIVKGMDWLVVAVEKLTEGVRIMTVAHKLVAQSVYCAGVITEQILHEYKLFLMPESKGEKWDSDEEVDLVQVEAEVEDLQHEMIEARDPGLPEKKKKPVMKKLVIDDGGEGFDRE